MKEEVIAGANEMIEIYNEIKFKHDYGEERLKIIRNVESVTSDNERSKVDNERDGNPDRPERTNGVMALVSDIPKKGVCNAQPVHFQQ